MDATTLILILAVGAVLFYRFRGEPAPANGGTGGQRSGSTTTENRNPITQGSGPGGVAVTPGGNTQVPVPLPEPPNRGRTPVSSLPAPSSTPNPAFYNVLRTDLPADTTRETVAAITLARTNMVQWDRIKLAKSPTQSQDDLALAFRQLQLMPLPWYSADFSLSHALQVKSRYPQYTVYFDDKPV